MPGVRCVTPRCSEATTCLRRRLAHLDQVSVWIADVATNLGSAIPRRREKVRAAPAPLLVHGFDVGNPDVEKGAGAVGVGWRLQGHIGLVLGGRSTDVDDDPA